MDDDRFGDAVSRELNDVSIELKRVVPEAMKPRKIEIAGGSGDGDRLEAPKGDDRAAA